MAAMHRLLPDIRPPEPFAALIFDCDGTLADTLPNHYRSWVEALRTFGGDFTPDDFYALSGMTTQATIALLNERYGYGLEVALTDAEKERRYVEGVRSVCEIRAVADVARMYFGRVPMAVATGATRIVVLATLRAAGLQNLFDTIVSADDVERGKPAPDVYLAAADRLGVKPQDCVVYEDADLGIEAARRAGMRVVDVRVLWDGRPGPTPLVAAP
ncbi:MAG: HAD family hydrolase [Capsulimonadaceae bacterium]